MSPRQSVHSLWFIDILLSYLDISKIRPMFSWLGSVLLAPSDTATQLMLPHLAVFCIVGKPCRTRTNARTTATTPLGVGSKVKRHRRNYENLLRRGFGQGAGRACRRRSPRILSGVIPFAMHEGIQNPYSLPPFSAKHALQRRPRLDPIITRHLVT